MRYLFACGGTAGHINPAVGIAGRLREKDGGAEFLFVGAEGRMETELMPREGYPIRTVRIDNMSRSVSLSGIRHNLRSARLLAGSLGEARRIIEEFRPDAAVGTGGYVCYPALRAAHALGIPTLVHESNAAPGLTTRMLARTVDAVLVGFERAVENYPKNANVLYTGTPVRTEFLTLDRAAARKRLGIPEDRKLLLSVWGSLGSGHINGLMPEFVRILESKRDFTLVHAAGKRYYAGLLAACGAPEMRRRAELREYIYDMPLWMAAADLVMCRSGASTLGELSALGKASLLVPSPNVTGHQQEKNARLMADEGASKVLLEGQFDAAGLYREAGELLSDKSRLAEMGRAARRCGVPDATERIAELVLEYARK